MKLKLITEKLSQEDAKRVKKLYKWMKNQGLSYGEAQHLMNVTKDALNDSKLTKMQNIKL